MSSILIDTSIVIDFLHVKDKNDSLLFRLIDKKIPLSLSIISHAELYSGKSVWKNKKAREELEEFLSQLTVLPVSTKISMRAGKIRSEKGTNLLDVFIAATALEENIPLATLNVKHFQNILGLKLYKT